MKIPFTEDWRLSRAEKRQDFELRLQEHLQERRLEHEIKLFERLSEAAVHDADEDAGWRPLTAAKDDRSLTPLEQDDMQRLGAQMWSRNPDARHIVEIQVAYVWGGGMRYEATDERVQRILDEHYEHPTNDWEQRGERMVRSLAVFGEYCPAAFVRKEDGFVKFGTIDPARIDTIEVSPNNIEELQWVNCKMDEGMQQKRYRVVHLDSKGFTPQIRQPWALPYIEAAADTTGRFVGNAFFFAVNRLPSTTRGRSDLYALIDWLDFVFKVYVLRAKRAEILNRSPLKAKVAHASINALLAGKVRKEVESILTGNLKSKALLASDELDWEYLTPDIKGGDMADELGILFRPILSGSHYPIHWFGMSEGMSRATALEMGDPTLTWLQSRQRQVRRFMEDVGRFVIDQARIFSDRLNGVENFDFKVVAPEISVKDQAKIATVVVQVANTLVIANSNGWIDDEQCKQVIRLLLGQFGVDLLPIFTKPVSEKAAEVKESLQSSSNDKVAQTLAYLSRTTAAN